MYNARLLATHSIHIFPFHFPSRASRCAIWFRTCHTTLYCIQSQKRPGLKTCSISVSFHQENAKWSNKRVFQKISALHFFWLYLLRTSKANYITFLYSHPALRCIFSQHPTNYLMPSAKNVFGWARSHWCTAAFTSSSHENHLAFLSGPKRWKSDGAKFGL